MDTPGSKDFRKSKHLTRKRTAAASAVVTKLPKITVSYVFCAANQRRHKISGNILNFDSLPEFYACLRHPQ